MREEDKPTKRTFAMCSIEGCAGEVVYMVTDYDGVEKPLPSCVDHQGYVEARMLASKRQRKILVNGEGGKVVTEALVDPLKILETLP